MSLRFESYPRTIALRNDPSTGLASMRTRDAARALRAENDPLLANCGFGSSKGTSEYTGAFTPLLSGLHTKVASVGSKENCATLFAGVAPPTVVNRPPT